MVYLKLVAKKWGNSVAFRLPKAVVEQEGWKVGDHLSVTFIHDTHKRVKAANAHKVTKRQ